MINFLFPLIKVKVVGRTLNVDWLGRYDYCLENENGERRIISESGAWAKVGDEIKVRNYRICWG